MKKMRVEQGNRKKQTPVYEPRSFRRDADAFAGPLHALDL